MSSSLLNNKYSILAGTHAVALADSSLHASNAAFVSPEVNERKVNTHNQRHLLNHGRKWSDAVQRLFIVVRVSEKWHMRLAVSDCGVPAPPHANCPGYMNTSFRHLKFHAKRHFNLKEVN
jgi:hypothetical protein